MLRDVDLEASPLSDQLFTLLPQMPAGLEIGKMRQLVYEGYHGVLPSLPFTTVRPGNIGKAPFCVKDIFARKCDRKMVSRLIFVGQKIPLMWHGEIFPYIPLIRLYER